MYVLVAITVISLYIAFAPSLHSTVYGRRSVGLTGTFMGTILEGIVGRSCYASLTCDAAQLRTVHER